MNARGFLDVADQLSTDATEGHWRSAVSRAYYAAFHAARTVMEGCGFAVPRAEGAHQHLILRLQNCGHPDVEDAGRKLEELRRARNHADYDLSRPQDQAIALHRVHVASNLLALFEDALANAPLLTRITQTMRDYERNVLQDVTWRGP
jgi:uncharacterized protein (UPF0332 family)